MGEASLFVTMTLNDEDEGLNKFITLMNGDNKVLPRNDPIMTELYLNKYFEKIKSAITGENNKK